MLAITQNLLTSKRNRPALRNRNWYSIRKLKGIVIHWTANTNRGADAKANRNYFNTATRFASAHYVIDDHSIVQCIPDDEVAYHVGGSFYKPMGEQLREEGLTPNYFLIGLEMCVNEDGDWDRTYNNSVELTQHLMNKYNFGINNLYRHFDITGKLCPAMMIDESAWLRFKEDVRSGLNTLTGNPIKQGFINTAELNVRKGPGVQYQVVQELNQDDQVEIFEVYNNWFRVGMDRWLHKHYVKITFEKTSAVVNDPTGLNVRTGPGASYQKVDTLGDGSHIELYAKDGVWYRIGRNQWVHGGYIRLMNVREGRVTTSLLNVRSGPGTNHPRIKTISRNDTVKVFEESGNWYRIGNEEWVYGAFIEMFSNVMV